MIVEAKLSVMLFPFYKPLLEGKLTIQKIVSDLKAEGVGAFELMMSQMRASEKLWDEVYKVMRGASMVCSCYDIDVNLIGQSRADRDAALDVVEREVRFCKEKLDCPTVLICGTKPANGMSDNLARKLYAEQLVKVVERTKGYGVTITIEDFGVYPFFTASAAHCLEVLETANCPMLKFTFDSGNFLIGDDKPAAIFHMFKNYIAHVHIKDFAACKAGEQPSVSSIAGKRYRDCLIGEGEADVAEIVKLLKHNRYNGWLSIEVWGDNSLAKAIHGVKFVRRAWESA
jgi:sugar phosphate isomerase/epimerase